MKLILVRHGETDWNLQNRVQGRSDTELNALGRRQAEAVAQALLSEEIEAIYSSPLKRAMATARAIAHFHLAEVVLVDDLKELDVGELDGLTFTEMRERYAEFLRMWTEDIAGQIFPGGSCIRDLQGTACASIERMAARHPNGTVVVVSHNFAILSIICKLMDIDLRHMRRLRMQVAGMTTIELNDQAARLIAFNEVCHLDKLATP